MCKDVMRGTKAHVLIGNPRVLIKRTATNQTANSSKADRIAIGTQVQKDQAAKNNDSADDEVGDDAVGDDEVGDDEAQGQEETEVQEEGVSGELSSEQSDVSLSSAPPPAKKTTSSRKRSHQDDNGDKGEESLLQEPGRIGRSRAKRARTS
jgi:hypothetical protein